MRIVCATRLRSSSTRRWLYHAGRVWLVATCLVGLVGGPVAAQNLLVNGDFDDMLTGWSAPSVSVSPGAVCVPSQDGNPCAKIDVPFGRVAAFEQTVGVPGDAELTFRVFGQLDPTTVTVSVFDPGGTEHVLDQFIAIRVIEGYTFPGPVFTCTGNLPETKTYAIDGFGGQTVRIRFSATSPGFDGTFAIFDDIALTLTGPPVTATATVPVPTPTATASPSPTGPSAPSSMLEAALSADATTIPVTDVSVFPPAGTVRVDDELIRYQGTGVVLSAAVPDAGGGAAGSLLDAIRGVNGTIPAAHVAGAAVILVAITPCVGDCNGSHTVTVDELVRGVNIALDRLALDQCPAFDSDGSGTVTINELVIAVGAALNTCG